VTQDVRHLDPAAVAAQAAWLRRLARHLLRDEDAADDLVQDGWLAALARPPRTGTTRAWLATVLANLARKAVRGTRRRTAREQAVALIGAEPSTLADEILVRHEAQRRLADLVTGLREPYRSTLLLVYLDGLSAQAIACRQGVSSGTVRWRLKQARDELRRQLAAGDAAASGTGGALGLAPVAMKGGPDWTGILLMTAKTKAKLGTAVAVAVGMCTIAAWISCPGATGGRSETATATTMAVAPSDERAGPVPLADASSAKGQQHPPRAAPPRFVMSATGMDRDAGEPPDRRPGRPPEVLALDRRYDLTQDELLLLAANCEVRMDVPGLKTVNDLPQGWMERRDLDSMNVSPEERSVMWAAMARYRREETAALRRLYLERTGDHEGARVLDTMDLQREDNPRTARLLPFMDARHFSEGARIVAEELAGLDPAPTRFDAQVVASAAGYYRLQRALADAFERELAEALGPDRARHIRRNVAAGHTRRAWCH
jgi:RNA polymerase sigma factor (sigma-70 family)